MAAAQDPSRKGEMLKFFFQLLDMSNHMVDDILPDILLRLDKGTLEAMICRCSDTNSRFNVFLKLCEVINRKNLSMPSLNDTEAASSVKSEEHVPYKVSDAVICAQPKDALDNKSQVTNFSDLSGEDDDQDALWKEHLNKALDRYNMTSKVSNFFYCGICNVRVHHEDLWNAHFKGKNHIARVKTETGVLIACETCNFHIFSYNRQVDMIMSSREHRVLDNRINGTKNDASLPSKMDFVQPSPPSAEPKMAPHSQYPYSTHSQMPSKTSTLSTTSVKDRPPKSETRVVTFEGKVIHTDFVNLTTQMTALIENHESFAFCFCRPCEILCNSQKLWANHCSSNRHIQKMNTKWFDNVLAGCMQCDFGMVASKPIALCYMHYHIENCHKQSTRRIIDEEYIEIKHLNPKRERKNSKSSDQSSKGSTNNLNWSRCSSVNDVSRPSSAKATPEDVSVSGRSTPSQSDSNLHNGIDPKPRSPVSINLSPTNTKTEVTKPAEPAAQDNPMVAPFIQLLHKKEAAYKLNSSGKPFSGLCYECEKSDFFDEYDWLDHLMAHTANDVNYEVECSHCNTFLFGNAHEINSVLIPHKEHMRLDDVFSR